MDDVAPPPKRRRTSEDNSDYSPRLESPDRDLPYRRQSPERPGRRDGDGARRYTTSRSRSNSQDGGRYRGKTSPHNMDHSRHRSRSESSYYSAEGRRTASRSRSPQRRRSTARSISRSSHNLRMELSPRSSQQKMLGFKCIHTVPRVHERGITSVKFSPDLSLLAAASADSSISIFSVLQPFNLSNPIKLLRTLRGHLAGVNQLSWSPIGPNYTLASASDDKSILLWSPLSSDFPISPSPLTGHSNYVYSLAFSPKGNVLVTGSYDEAVFLWDVRSATVMRTLPAHSDPVSGVDFLHDGSMVCSCSSDGLIRIWDSGTGQCLKTLVDEDRKPVTSVRFSPNGKFLLAWTLDGCIRLWRYTENECVKTYTGHVNQEFSLSGLIGDYENGQKAFVVSGSEDGDVLAWDVSSKELLWRGKGHTDVVLSVDFGRLSDGTGILVSAGKDRDLRLWTDDTIPKEISTDGNRAQPTFQQEESMDIDALPDTDNLGLKGVGQDIDMDDENV